MGFIERISNIPQIIRGFLTAFLALIGVRVTYPMVDTILGLWTTTNQMKVTAILAMWLVYFFVIWVWVWLKFFQPKNNRGEN